MLEMTERNSKNHKWVGKLSTDLMSNTTKTHTWILKIFKSFFVSTHFLFCLHLMCSPVCTKTRFTNRWRNSDVLLAADELVWQNQPQDLFMCKITQQVLLCISLLIICKELDSYCKISVTNSWQHYDVLAGCDTITLPTIKWCVVTTCYSLQCKWIKL